MRSVLLAVFFAVLTTSHALCDNPRRAIAAEQSISSLDQIAVSTDRSASRKHSRKERGDAEPMIPDICRGC